MQLEKLKGCQKIFKEKRSGVDAGRPELKASLEYLREGDTLLVTKLDRLARSTLDLYRIVSQLSERGVSFKVIDDPSIDTTSRTGKLTMCDGKTGHPRTIIDTEKAARICTKEGPLRFAAYEGRPHSPHSPVTASGGGQEAA